MEGVLPCAAVGVAIFTWSRALAVVGQSNAGPAIYQVRLAAAASDKCRDRKDEASRGQLNTRLRCKHSIFFFLLLQME